MKNVLFATLLAFGCASQAGAAVYLEYNGAIPSDADSQGMADISTSSSTFYVDIFTDGVGGGTGSLNGFSLAVNDTAEISSITLSGSAAPFVFAITPATSTLLDYGFLGGFVSAGKLMTVLVTLGIGNAAPDDDLADLILAGSSTGGAIPQSVIDPLTGASVPFASYDVQTVPVPAAGLLLAGGLGLLGAARKRRKS